MYNVFCRGLKILLLFTSSIVFYHVIIGWGLKPSSKVVYLPKNFSGRVFAAQEVVSPKTLLLRRSVDEVASSGEDAILVYGYHPRDLFLEAWVPDKQTPGTFLYAKEEISRPSDWAFFHSAVSVEKKEGTVVFTPGFDWRGALIISSLTFSLTLFAWKVG